ncbi:MAG TPA: catalase [Bryobacteraceae bacterium]|nr:catalase [Bryobacteraceae bacterium]
MQAVVPKGGETHQQASGDGAILTTNQGLPLSDNQNSLKAGGRGPTLLEDFILREKITHFDHERIPERIVHARGSGAHGVFKPYKSMKRVTKAAFLSDPKVETPVFVRFSTVAGGAGSVDLPRDVRGFAVKFYTQEGNFDIVGNNIPVFFIQDAIKFPDLIHSVKMEADRGYPQAGSAHDTFWDFVSLMPESMHMVMWAMSDRAIPRSLRMMEGFGVNTFRLVNAAGETNFVKFHWRPLLGTAAVLWDEACKISGADPDYHRRDLFEAIDKGDFPEFELGFQIIDQKTADSLPFDVLDATKLIPEEVVPIEMVGRMVLNRNPDNFFAETEQVAFCPSHIVPGIDFSEDPLLQGRLFSYLDTQLSRLGSPNFHELPINRPKCPFANFQRDGHMQMLVPKGRANYEPNSIDPSGPRESPSAGLKTAPVSTEGTKVRLRAESFADHYSQARLFYRSVTPQEQKHLAQALTFELSKVDIREIRQRILGHLNIVDPTLGATVAEELGMAGEAISMTPSATPIDLPPSPALRLYGKYKPTLKGRKVGVLLAPGFNSKVKNALVAAIQAEGATAALIAPKVGGAEDSGGAKQAVDMALSGAPSVMFDAVAILAGPAGDQALTANPDAVGFLMDASRHLKAIGLAGVPNLAAKAHAAGQPGITDLTESKQVAAFIDFARKGKVWEREPAVSPSSKK